MGVNISHDTKVTLAFALVLLAGMFYLGMKVQKLDSMDGRLANLEQSWYEYLLKQKILTKK